MNETLSIEQLKYSYFDEDFLRHPSYDMYRMATPKGRYYYSYDKRGKVKFYISVTNIIKSFTPTPPFLLDWIAKQGQEGAEKAMKRRGAYGTLMHDTIEELLINKKIDLDTIPDRVDEFFANNDTWGAKKEEFVDELYKDITAFSQFMIDRNVTPIAIEVVLKSDKYKTAGALDLFCSMNFNKKRVKAIVDFKSSKKGFYEDNEIQLEYYKSALLEEWPEFENEEIMLFNWSGKNWKKNPDYNFKNQTNKHTKKELKLYSDLYKEKTKNKPIENTSIIDFFGTIDITKKSIDDNYKVLTLNSKIKENDKNKKQKSNRKNTSTNNRKNKDRGESKKSSGKGVSGEPRLF